MRNVEVAGRKGLGYGSVVSHKEDQFPIELDYYGKKNPILVNLVPMWNRSKKQNVEFGKLWVTVLQENYVFEIDDNIS
jgi:hypothetical protein